MTLLCTILITLFTFIKLGLYRAVLRYISFKALAMVAGGAFVSAVSLIFFSFFIGSDIPRTVPIIYFSSQSLITLDEWNKEKILKLQIKLKYLAHLK